ncbi:MAG: antitoxin [Desulfobacterales bacterium]|jgi:plasmid stability protein
MKTITVRGIENELAEKLKDIASQEGKSVNQHILETLKKSCGLEKEKKFTQVYQDMDHLFGKWSAEDFKRIQGKIDAERKIDPELW